jgi:hypothetical protein
MTKAEKLKHCIGCSENFYNGNNPLGVKECWNLKNARLILRKRVGMWQRPPWEQPPVKALSCKRDQGYVFVQKDRTS